MRKQGLLITMFALAGLTLLGASVGVAGIKLTWPGFVVACVVIVSAACVMARCATSGDHSPRCSWRTRV